MCQNQRFGYIVVQPWSEKCYILLFLCPFKDVSHKIIVDEELLLISDH